MALFHIIVWLIHAVVLALASALVDVFTHLAAALLALVVLAACGAGLAAVFGIGSFGLVRRRRRRRRE